MKFIKKTSKIERQSRKYISYKITKEQVKYAIKKLKENQQITMNELVKIIKKKYKNYFLYAFDKEKLPSGVSTLRRQPKFYKD